MIPVSTKAGRETIPTESREKTSVVVGRGIAGKYEVLGPESNTRKLCP
jgi:hypothetical protein